MEELQGVIKAQEIRINERIIERSSTVQALQAQTSRKNDGGSSKDTTRRGKVWSQTAR